MSEGGSAWQGAEAGKLIQEIPHAIFEGVEGAHHATAGGRSALGGFLRPAAHGIEGVSEMGGLGQFMTGAGGALGALGVGLGVHSVISGGSELFENWDDKRSEGFSNGLWEVGSGLLGTAAGIGGLGAAGVSLLGGTAAVAGGAGGALGSIAGAASTLACPPLAIAAGLAGLGAIGNGYATEHGWYGTETNEAGEEVGKTFTGSIADAYNDAGGGLGGVASGALQTVENVGAALGGGVMQIVSWLSDERLKVSVAPIRGALELLESL